jgi:hypothetical protein
MAMGSRSALLRGKVATLDSRDERGLVGFVLIGGG